MQQKCSYQNNVFEGTGRGVAVHPNGVLIETKYREKWLKDCGRSKFSGDSAFTHFWKAF